MLRLMTASDQSQADNAILPSYCLLFKTTTDSITSILSYMSMVNICRLDTAVTNTASRAIWLSILRGTSHHSINNHKHSHGSIRWLVERDISPEYLETNGKECIACKINGDALLGLDVSSLRIVSLCQCNIRDKDVLRIAGGCPSLTDIRLGNCHDITDASMIALARCCRQLIFIDIGGCSNITDRGLTAYADACRNVSNTRNLLERGEGSGLRKISVAYCKRITVVGISAQ